MRLTTWNVNGIRNPFGYAPWHVLRTFPSMFDILESDIVVMQELKIQRKDLRDDMVLLDGWDCYFSLPKHKKGYSGVGIYTRNATCAPIRAEEGVLGVLSPPSTTTAFRDLPEDQHIGGYPSELQIAELGVDPLLLDSEGRCVCLEFPAFVLFGVYSPANSNGLRDDFRYGFLCALDCRIRNLVKMGKRVVLVGDLNVSRGEMDTANAVEDMRKAGLTHDEYISTPNRRVFNQLIHGGEVIGERDEGRETAVLWDLAREFHPDRKGMYTHWEQKVNARPGNFGSRIDFVLVSGEMKDWFSDSNIQEGLMGSDHCPVYGTFKDEVGCRREDGSLAEVHLLDIMSPPGTFSEGARQRLWTTKDIPAMSGKLLPEFDKRRSIKDMFKKPSLTHAASSSNAVATLQQAVTIVPSGTKDTQVDNASTATAASPIDPPATQASPVKPSPAASPASTADLKRKPSDPPATKASKRPKPSTQASSTKGEAGKGQQSLKGFFAPKSKPAATSIPHNNHAIAVEGNGMSELYTAKHAADTSNTANGGGKDDHTCAPPVRPGSQSRHTTPPPHSTHSVTAPRSASKPDPPPPPSPSVASTDGSVHDPIATKESWSKLLRKPNAPLCEHSEPCKSMLTKKKGENQGRSFWMCQRPLGPSGAKERNTQWRCSTFIWCSDYKGES